MVLGSLFLWASVVVADTSVQSPATFTLKVNEKATVTNVLDMQIKLQKIDTYLVGTAIGFEPGQPDPNTYGLQKSVEINVSTVGGCGPIADPRCLGMPGFESTYTIGESGSVSALGLNIKVTNIGENNATFAIGLPDVTPSPAPVPGVSNPGSSGNSGSVSGGSNDDLPIPLKFNLPKGQEVVSTEKVEATPETFAYYEIKTKKKARLFFIFPVYPEITYSVDAETGESKVIDRPWWNFLAW